MLEASRDSSPEAEQSLEMLPGEVIFRGDNVCSASLLSLPDAFILRFSPGSRFPVSWWQGPSLQKQQAPTRRPSAQASKTEFIDFLLSTSLQSGWGVKITSLSK